jgi:UDP-N-acetylmuramate dehydrogenase
MKSEVEENKDLFELNTLRLHAHTRYYCEINSVDELANVVTDSRFKGSPIFALGSGSNTLFSRDYSGLVLKINLQGKTIISEDEKSIELEIAAGEDWPELVSYVVEKNWGGVENLAYIPGTAGAAPVQNIAAYGQNFSDILSSVTYYSLETNQTETLTADACQFGYRDSIFKRQLKQKAIITSIHLTLAKNPELETSYYSIGGRNDSLQKELSSISTGKPTVKDVYTAVVAIRKRKLLDWKTDPTVGSYFINPVVSREKYQKMKEQDPDLQAYPVTDLKYHQTTHDNQVKVPVGRLLDVLGWKGKVVGNCQVHDKLASIFTHNGKATGAEFLAFVNQIQADVHDKFKIDLQSEVSII